MDQPHEPFTTQETINVPMPPPSVVRLPDYLHMAVGRLETEARKIREAQYRLLSLFLKAERIDGEWTFSPDMTSAIRVPPAEQHPAE